MANNLRRCEVCTATVNSLNALETHTEYHERRSQIDSSHELTLGTAAAWHYALCSCGWQSLRVEDTQMAADCWHDHKLVVAELGRVGVPDG